MTLKGESSAKLRKKMADIEIKLAGVVMMPKKPYAKSKNDDLRIV